MARLSNYLLSNRKRLGLSQEEVAFLMGAQSGAKISRYERFAREPSLATALALEVIYQKPASELFGGLYQKVQRDVVARAKNFTYKVDRGKANSQAELRRQSITNLANKIP
jgi:transcriptional regulator with XRE-family HTH domain